MNSCLEEMQDLWKIGDEYLLPKFEQKRLGLHKESKLIVSSIYENENKIVFMNMLVRWIYRTLRRIKWKKDLLNRQRKTLKEKLFPI